MKAAEILHFKIKLKLTGPSEVRQIIIKGKVLYFNKMFNNWTSSQKRFHRTDLLQYKSVK